MKVFLMLLSVALVTAKNYVPEAEILIPSLPVRRFIRPLANPNSLPLGMRPNEFYPRGTLPLPNPNHITLMISEARAIISEVERAIVDAGSEASR